MELVASSLPPTTACIVGGGPAGMMLGLLLARAGVPVVVLEKHKDFFRDFRGDTIHPATLELMHQLGLLPALLKLPHQKVEQASVMVGGQVMPISDFTHLPTQAKFIALMPQWDLLNFLAAEAAKYPGFRLLMEHQATGLIKRGGRISGVTIQTPEGEETLSAQLVVGCDGRHATTTEAAHLKVVETGVPIDVLWFRLSRKDDDPENALGVLNFGQMMVLINRGDYFQVGYIIRKGTFETDIRPVGLDAFRAGLVRLAPFLGDRVGELGSWDQVKLLTVQVNHLRHWHVPGLLCIGDAAHAMSPVGGIGINLAIQDAVAAANILTSSLLDAARRGTVITTMTLEKVQHRREFATRLTQRFQEFAHGMLNRILGDPAPMRPNWVLRTLSSLPIFRRLAGRAIGMGVLPEKIPREI
jgi:2-polyprenyl-6-methoxyphenol hydroxylase-like FAD-dependent oxidoreductase